MSSKQDLVAARTAQDVERKYNFGKTFAEVFGMAEEAQKAAEKAQQAADNATGAVGDLDQDAIFNLLTNNGEIKGLFMKDGQLYINASYLVTGVIKSENGKLVIDLSGETSPTFNTGISTNGLTVRSDEAESSGYVRINPLKMTLQDGSVRYYPSFWMNRMDDGTLFHVWADKNDISRCTMPSPDMTRQIQLVVGDNIASGLKLTNASVDIGSLVIDENAKSHLTIEKINGKTVSWKANGDGTFTLVGQ